MSEDRDFSSPRVAWGVTYTPVGLSRFRVFVDPPRQFLYGDQGFHRHDWLGLPIVASSKLDQLAEDHADGE